MAKTDESWNELARAARAWALADRASSDRALEVAQIETLIADSQRPVPMSILSDRDALVIALRDACRAENIAELAMRDAARDFAKEFAKENAKP
jgi:hypothetical protein